MFVQLSISMFGILCSTNYWVLKSYWWLGSTCYFPPQTDTVGHQLPVKWHQLMMILRCWYSCVLSLIFLELLRSVRTLRGFLGMISDSIQAPLSPEWHGWCACRLGLDPRKQTWRTPLYMLLFVFFWLSEHLYFWDIMKTAPQKGSCYSITPSNLYIYPDFSMPCSIQGVDYFWLFYTNSSDGRWHRP